MMRYAASFCTFAAKTITKSKTGSLTQVSASLFYYLFAHQLM